MAYPTFEVIHINVTLRDDYMEIFNSGWNFNLLNELKFCLG